MAEISIYAHRGGPLNAPENTVAAFKTAFSNGAAAVECDIRRTADGQFVAFHDASTGRLCGTDWKIAQTAWPHLKTLRVLGQEPVAHLDDILNLMILHPLREFYFEMALARESDAADLALQIAKAGVQSRAFLLAFSPRRGMLETAAAAVPGIGIAVMPLFPRDLLGCAFAAGAQRVCTGWLDLPLSKSLFAFGASAFDLGGQIRAAGEAGIKVSAGVANTPRDLRWLASFGPDAIWTDDVAAAARFL